MNRNFKHDFILAIFKLNALKDYDNTFKVIISKERISKLTKIPKKQVEQLIEDLEVFNEIVDFGEDKYLIVDSSEIEKNWRNSNEHNNI